MKINEKWDIRFLEMAKMVSSWSKDPSTQVGSIAVNDKGLILSTGWNGFPRGIADTAERLNDREIKYKHVVHAEMNVIYNATFNGISLDKSTLYVYGMTICSECAKGIIQVGVDRVVMSKNCVNERWAESWKQSESFFQEASVRIDFIEGVA